MKKLYLHIGSYKTGTTSIQNILYKNRNEIQKQGFLYPGKEANHHKFFFVTKSAKEKWPRQFRSIHKGTLNQIVQDYFSELEKDLKSNYEKQIISTEYLFIDDKKGIQHTMKYLQNFFSDIKIFIFVRDPVDYYASAQQQMIKGRSFLTSPVKYKYAFKNVIEAWKEYCEVNVLEYDRQKNSCEIFCKEIGLDFNQLSAPEQRTNTSLSVEQMTLLEKIQRAIYPHKENVFKPQLGLVQNINPKFISKPKLKESVKNMIYKNHEEDLEWLKKEFSIDFSENKCKNFEHTSLPKNYTEKVAIRDVYQVDEQTVERYEALVTDVLLKKLVQVQS